MVVMKPILIFCCAIAGVAKASAAASAARMGLRTFSSSGKRKDIARSGCTIVHGRVQFRLVLIRHAAFGLLMVSAVALAQPLVLTNVTVIDVAGGASQRGMTVVIERRAHRCGGADSSGKGASCRRHRQVPHPRPLGHARPLGTRVRVDAGAVPAALYRERGHWHSPDGRPPGLPPVARTGGRRNAAGPRMVLAGAIVDGPKPFWRDSIAASTTDDGRQAVQRTQQDGYDFVKVYELAVARRSFSRSPMRPKKLSAFRFAGHVPDRRVGVAEASDAGQKRIEHLTGLLLGGFLAGDRAAARIRRCDAARPQRSAPRDCVASAGAHARDPGRRQGRSAVCQAQGERHVAGADLPRAAIPPLTRRTRPIRA